MGLTLLTSLALGAGAAPAFAAAPENTALPVISPSTPHLGLPETTSNGEWTNSPTSFTYRWWRCNAGGVECALIGAETATYTPVGADIGHTLVTSVTAYNASGSKTAKSNPTNVLTLGTEYWYRCKNVGKSEGSYEDPFCAKYVGAGKGSYSLKKLTAPTAFSMAGTTPMTWSWKIGGVAMAATCSTQTSKEGTLENPSGGGAGTASLAVSFGGCAMTVPAKQTCEVSALQGTPLAGLATEFEGKPAVRFTGTGGYLVSLKVTANGPGCAFPGEYTLNGALNSIVNSSTSSLEFTKAGSEMLYAGNPATFEGMSKIETNAGEALKVAP